MMAVYKNTLYSGVHDYYAGFLLQVKWAKSLLNVHEKEQENAKLDYKS